MAIFHVSKKDPAPKPKASKPDYCAKETITEHGYPVEYAKLGELLKNSTGDYDEKMYNPARGKSWRYEFTAYVKNRNPRNKVVPISGWYHKFSHDCHPVWEERKIAYVPVSDTFQDELKSKYPKWMLDALFGSYISGNYGLYSDESWKEYHENMARIRSNSDSKGNVSHSKKS